MKTKKQLLTRRPVRSAWKHTTVVVSGEMRWDERESDLLTDLGSQKESFSFEKKEVTYKTPHPKWKKKNRPQYMSARVQIRCLIYILWCRYVWLWGCGAGATTDSYLCGRMQRARVWCMYRDREHGWPFLLEQCAGPPPHSSVWADHCWNSGQMIDRDGAAVCGSQTLRGG